MAKHKEAYSGSCFTNIMFACQILVDYENVILEILLDMFWKTFMMEITILDCDELSFIVAYKKICENVFKKPRLNLDVNLGL